MTSCLDDTDSRSSPPSPDWSRAQVASFLEWYNTEYLHSGIRFVTPHDRHFRREPAILENRRHAYEGAHRQHSERWSGRCRDWQPVQEA